MNIIQMSHLVWISMSEKKRKKKQKGTPPKPLHIQGPVHFSRMTSLSKMSAVIGRSSLTRVLFVEWYVWRLFHM